MASILNIMESILNIFSHIIINNVTQKKKIK